MDDTILAVGASSAPFDLPDVVRTDLAGLARRLTDNGAGEPCVVLFDASLDSPLQQARAVRARWQACELIFVAAAAHYDSLRASLGRAPMIGSHWSALAQGDPSLAATVADAAKRARRRARLRTTLERANVSISAPRQVDDPQLRRHQVAAHYLDSFLAQTRDGIVGLDKALRVVHWNESASGQWGLHERDALGRPARELPFWNAELESSVRAALEGATGSHEHGYSLHGREVCMEFSISGVRDEQGRWIGASLVIRDITERHQRLERERLQAAERARVLDEELRRLFDMFALAPGFMSVTKGPQHVFEMANHAYAALFGERTRSAISVAAAFPELAEQPFVALRDQVYATGVPYVGKAQPIWTRDPDGSVRQRYIDFVYQPWRDASGEVKGIFCQGHDVTEHQMVQDGLLTHQTELEQLVTRRTADLQKAHLALHQSQKLEAIGKLTGGVAHDFNNILQVIGSNLDLIGLQPHLDAAVRGRLSSSTAAVERAARLSAQLLAFARRQPLQPVPTNVAHVLRDMDELLRRALGQAIDVGVSIAPQIWNTLVDRNQLENVILNLGINARDAMGAVGRLTIELTNAELDQAYTSADTELQAGQYVLLAISDNGSGMSAEVKERAFEPFYTTKEDGKGTGLGLSMAYGFVKQSGGHITLYSEPGEGTTVRIYLPRCYEAEQQVERSSDEQIRGGSETVLVVEDDAAVRIAVIDLLKGLGYAVLSAYDASSALAMLEGGAAPDLLFTDVVMPGEMRSPELARHAQRLVPGIGILFTSGYTQNAIVHAGRLDPGVELLSKPYRRADLARKVRQVIDQARVPQAAAQRVVVVEDNDDGRELLHELLLALGYESLCFGTAEGVLEALRATDILLTDVTLPGISGLELAEQAQRAFPNLRVVFASGRGLAPQSVRGRILPKPFTIEQLGAVLE